MSAWSTYSRAELWREAPGTDEINIVISLSGRGNYCWLQNGTDSQKGCTVSIQRPIVRKFFGWSHVLLSGRGNKGEKARKRTQSYLQTANLSSSMGGTCPGMDITAELTCWYSLPARLLPRSPPAWERLESLIATQTSDCLRLPAAICISAPTHINPKLGHYYKMGKHQVSLGKFA